MPCNPSALRRIGPLAVALWFSAPASAVDPWQIQTLDTRGDVGQASALALDAQNRPHIVYADRDIVSQLGYARWDGVSWHFETVVEAALALNGRGLGLAVDSGGNPQVAYYDATQGDVVYRVRSATGWNEAFRVSVGDVGRYLALALDGLDRPHISYYDATGGNLHHAFRDAAGWHIEIVDNAGDVGAWNSLAVGKVGANPDVHIVYYDATNGALKYARKSGASWQIEIVPLVLGATGGGLATALALSSAGEPHIVYAAEKATAPRTTWLSHAYKTGGAWSSFGLIAEAPGKTASEIDYRAALALDPTSGAAHVAYSTAATQFLTYTVSSGAGWAASGRSSVCCCTA